MSPNATRKCKERRFTWIQGGAVTAAAAIVMVAIASSTGGAGTDRVGPAVSAPTAQNAGIAALAAAASGSPSTRLTTLDSTPPPVSGASNVASVASADHSSRRPVTVATAVSAPRVSTGTSAPARAGLLARPAAALIVAAAKAPQAAPRTVPMQAMAAPRASAAPALVEQPAVTAATAAPVLPAPSAPATVTAGQIVGASVGAARLAADASPAPVAQTASDSTASSASGAAPGIRYAHSTSTGAVLNPDATVCDPSGPYSGDAFNSGAYASDGTLLTLNSDPAAFYGPLTGTITTGGTFELVNGTWMFNPNSEGAIEMFGSAQAASDATGVPLAGWWGDGPAPPGACG